MMSWNETGAIIIEMEDGEIIKLDAGQKCDMWIHGKIKSIKC